MPAPPALPRACCNLNRVIHFQHDKCTQRAPLCHSCHLILITYSQRACSHNERPDPTISRCCHCSSMVTTMGASVAFILILRVGGAAVWGPDTNPEAARERGLPPVRALSSLAIWHTLQVLQQQAAVKSPQGSSRRLNISRSSFLFPAPSPAMKMQCSFMAWPLDPGERGSCLWMTAVHAGQQFVHAKH